MRIIKTFRVSHLGLIFGREDGVVRNRGTEKERNGEILKNYTCILLSTDQISVKRSPDSCSSKIQVFDSDLSRITWPTFS